MKESTRLTKYFLRQSGLIIRLLHKPLATFEEADFHMLRVHIKKIKVVFNLVAYGVHDFSKEKYFKPYKTIFRRAGKIRELQLQLSLMKQYGTNEYLDKYYSQLETDVTQFHQDFLSSSTKKLKRKLKNNNRVILPLLQVIDKRIVKKYLSSKKEAIEKLLHAEKLNAEQVHDLRKHIKELNYLHNIFKPKNQALTIPDEFQELIGTWHDYDVISNDLLKDAQHHELSPQEVKAIMDLQQKIATRADQLLAKVEIAKARI